jgi:hypothetical protein
MLLLSPFVTILRMKVEAMLGTIIRPPLWPIPAGSNDFSTTLSSNCHQLGGNWLWNRRISGLFSLATSAGPSSGKK